VNYAIRFSGPVTAPTARRVRYGVGLDLICQPGPSPGIKTNSVPPLFQQLSPSLLFPSPLSPPFPSCLRPRRAPLTPLLGLLVPTGYGVANEKNVAARRLTLIHSTPRQYYLVNRLTRASIPNNDADGAPGVPAGHRRLSHATTSDPRPLLSLLQASSTDPSDLLTFPRDRQGRVITTPPLLLLIPYHG
jgi:hypothetical protein